jgi:hypothetical protein
MRVVNQVAAGRVRQRRLARQIADGVAPAKRPPTDQM